MTLTDDQEAENELKKQQSFISSWLKELDAAREREKTFRKDGEDVIKLYEAEKNEESPFNILYSNTETLQPALYNSVPRPVVQRRFKDEDPLGKAASTLCQRSLEFLIDSDIRDYTPFDELMQFAVLGALVPGRGITRFKYDAEIETVEEETAEQGESKELPETEAQPSSSYEKVTEEIVCGEAVDWNRFLHGYAKRWQDVPWIAFEHFMTKDELEDNFGEEIAAKVELESYQDDREDGKGPGKEAKNVKLGHVYEIWDKLTRKVLFICPQCPDAVLKQVEDPLGLSGFFPVPRPLMLVKRLSTLIPKPLYKFYEEQSKELNRVTTRINKLIVALKVRGLYDSTVQGIDKVMTAEDNTFIPADNVSSLLQGQTLEKALFLMPIDKLITVLQQLYTQRTQVKQVIYEITGIADIMRGSSSASETLGAQELKNQWGTLRLKRMQKEVARYARDSLRIMAEIAVTKLSPDTLRKMTGMPLMLGQEKAQASGVVQQLGAAGQQVPQEIAAALQKPSMEELLKLLRDDLSRSYRIDIETNSTVDAEATEDKQDMSELMNAMAQFLNGVAPAVEKGVLPFQAAKAMLLGLVRKFRFGADVEDELNQMQAPPPPQAPEKPQGEDPAVLQAKTQGDLAAEQMRQQTLQMEMQFKQQEHQFKMQELQLKAQLTMAQHHQAMEKAQQAVLSKPAGNTPA